MVIADAPARALVIIGDGLAGAVNPSSHTHLHALAAAGSCGFLALRAIPPTVGTNDRALFEMQQILDLNEYPLLHANSVENADPEHNLPSVSDRFMGMKAALISNSRAISEFSKRAGFSLMNSKFELETKGDYTESTNSGLPDPSVAASQLTKFLGLGIQCNDFADSYELILLHLESCSDSENAKNLDWIDCLLGEIKALTQPGTKMYDHLYLALVLGYGDKAFIRDEILIDKSPTLQLFDELPSNLKALRPIQSYQMKNGKLIEDVRDHHPLIVVHQMDGVTLRDRTTFLSFDEIKKNGSRLAVLADRFFHEIAFKLWKAPKYGA